MKTQMLSIPPVHLRLCSRGTSLMTAVGRMVRVGRPSVPTVLKALLASAILAAVSAHAATYDFLSVTITGTNTGTFTSTNGNGFITATTVGVTNISGNNTVYLSQFTNLFLPSGTVQGWLTRYDNYAIYTNTFYLTNYALSSNTVFGFWNITEDYEGTYCLQLFAGNTLISPPFTWNFIGYDDNSGPTDVNIAHHHMVLNTTNGCFTTTNYPSSGTIDCDGAFWDNIPTNTTRIVLSGSLRPDGMDGVVFYFAEPRPCVLTCPSNITVTICGTGTNVTYPPPTLSGDCGTNTTGFCDPASGSYFLVGTNMVTCMVPGYPNTCSFTVTVLNSDPIPPVITCPSNIVVFTCSTNSVVNYTVTATDNSGTVTTNCSPPSGSTFPLGTNAVGCIAIDACSNATPCAFYVIVIQTPPTWGLICPDESSSINVTGCPPVMPNLTNLVTITNDCPIPGGLSITQAPPAGTVLSSGTYPVTITVCSTNGTCEYCYLNVIATLSTGCCTMDCPTNITVTTCGTNAVANYPTPTVSGPCASNVTVVCTPPSGSTFPLGTNTVTCTATNGAGATVIACSFTVTVAASAFASTYDFLSVSITGPGGKFTSPNGNGFITVTNTGGPFLGLNNTVYPSQFPNLFPASGTVTGWLAQANNNANYTNTFYLTNYTLSASTVFGIWSITEEPNTYSVKLLDASNNLISPLFTWNFIGYDDDSLSGNIAGYHMVLNPTTGFLSTTQYNAFGIDCDGAFWDNIPLNTHKIVVTGSLGADNADGVVFYFAERRPCVNVTCPANITAGTCGTNAVVNYSAPTVTGAAASSVTVTCTPPSGSSFPLGTNTVTCTATNATGTLVDSCSFTVTVAPALPTLCSTALTATRDGTNVVLSWPDSAPDFILEEAADLLEPLSTVWTTVTNSPTTADGKYQVTLPAQRPKRFYRLKQTTH